MLKKSFSITLFTINLFCTVFAQDINFKHYSVDNGLLGSQVHDIFQDKCGNLWFSTDQGLSRYDGYSFKNYTTADGLTDNTIFKFFPQSNGDIWCTTLNKSVFYIRGNEPVFKPYRFNKILRNVPDNFVSNCLYISNDNSLFMSFVSGLGYICVDSVGEIAHNSIGVLNKVHETILLTDKSGHDFFFTHPINLSENVIGNWTNTIHSSKDSSGGYVKACIFKKVKRAVFTDTKSIRIVTEGSIDPLVITTSFEPISLGKLNDTLFWVGFRYGGAGIFNMSGKKIQSFLLNKSVTRLLIDHEGGYWLSTLNDGVFHTNNISLSSYQTDKTVDTWVNSLAKDKSNNLWLGYYNGDISVILKNRIIKKHAAIIKKPALTSFNNVSKETYFITDGKLFNIEKKESLFDLGNNPVNFYAHKNDSLLVASYRAIYIFHGKKKKELMTGFRVSDICFHNGKFYLAGNRGLYELNGQTIKPCSNPLLPSAKISDLDSWNNKLIMAVEGQGIIITDNNSIYKIDQKLGLSNNIVNKLYIENDTTLWACTNSGLSRIVFKSEKVKHINIISSSDGLLSNEITDIEIINDTAWVGTRKGLCSFPMVSLKKKKKITDHYLAINRFKVNDKVCDQTLSNLSYNQNRIEFEFKAISFLESTPILYRYILIGLENKWNYTNGLSTVYTSLPPGNYTFIVEAKGSNSFWESGHREFSFIISPPFWKTWWFILTIIIFSSILVYLFFRFRILSYNRDIMRELLRQLVKRLTKKTNYVVFNEQGKDIRIATNEICIVKASGNYVEIQTDTKKYVIRYKIGDFLTLVPDPLEYLRISRSYIVRIDKIHEKSKKNITIRGEKIPVGETYLEEVQKIKF